MTAAADGDALLSVLAGSGPRHRAAAMAALQGAGNAAMARRLARWRGSPTHAVLARQDTVAPPATAPEEVPAVPPETERRIVYAATILNRMPPLDAGREERLGTMIGGSPTYDRIRERTARQRHLEELRDSFAELEARTQDAARLAPGEMLPGGVPPSEEQMLALGEEIYAAALEVEELDAAVQADLARLGIADEHELEAMVEHEFPALWVRRAKEIAYRMLDENRAVAEAEMDRYRDEGMCTLDVEELRTADAELAVMARDQRSLAEQVFEAEQRRDAKSEELQRAEELVRWAQEPGGLPGGVPPSGDEIVALSEEVERIDAEITSLRESEGTTSHELDEARRRHAARLPILLMDRYRPGMFENASEEHVGRMTGAMVQDVLENIEQTRENIADDTVKVWDLRDVPDLAFQDLDVPRDSALGAAVEAHVADERSDEGALDIALGALAVVAGIVAGVATGGLALFAFAAATGLGLYEVSRRVSEHSAESAAEEVSIDPAVADISNHEPELMWVVLAVVGVVADVGGVVAALRPAARGLMAAGEVADFAAEARRIAPEAADRLIVSAERQAAGGGSRRVQLLHGTDESGFQGLDALGAGRIDVGRSPGAGQDLGRGFYMTTDRATAEAYAFRRRIQRGTNREDVLFFEVGAEELGTIVDIRRGGNFRAEWEAYLDGPVEGIPEMLRSHPGLDSVRSFVLTRAEHRGETFERFLRSIGMADADTIFAPLGDGVFTGITSGAGETTQVCIRSQRVADRLNAMIRGEPPLGGPAGAP